MRWRPVCALFGALLVVVAACGGRSIRHGEGDAGEGADGPDFTGGIGGVGGRTGGTGMGATGGTGMGATGGTGMGATGGTGMGATGGSAAGAFTMLPRKHCEFGGILLVVGEVVEDPLICQRCVCRDYGVVDCSHCDATCRVAATTLEAGESLLMPDGCTTCLCTVYGTDCSSNACATPDPCRDLATEYEITVGALRWCGPQAEDYTCVDAVSVPETIPCGCDTVARSSHAYTKLADEYYAMGCAVPFECDKPCSTPPAYPYRCGESGFCVGHI
jgi:hypothetical protein